MKKLFIIAFVFTFSLYAKLSFAADSLRSEPYELRVEDVFRKVAYTLPVARSYNVKRLRDMLSIRVPWLSQDQYVLIFAGKCLNDELSLDWILREVSTIHLVMRAKASSSMIAAPKFAREIEDLQKSIAGWRTKADLINWDFASFIKEAGKFASCIMTSFHHRLPLGYFPVAVKALADRGFDDIVSDEDLANWSFLKEHALKYIKNYTVIERKQIAIWYKNKNEFYDYLKCGISYYVALHYMLNDERKGPGEQLFLPNLADRQEFIDAYDSYHSETKYAARVKSYKEYHGIKEVFVERLMPAKKAAPKSELVTAQINEEPAKNDAEENKPYDLGELIVLDEREQKYEDLIDTIGFHLKNVARSDLLAKIRSVEIPTGVDKKRVIRFLDDLEAREFAYYLNFSQFDGFYKEWDPAK